MGQSTSGRENWQRRDRVPIDGQVIRRAREAKGWSREKLAAELGLSHRTVERYETGARRPPRDTMLRLTLLLGVTLTDLGVDLTALLPPHARGSRA